MVTCRIEDADFIRLVKQGVLKPERGGVKKTTAAELIKMGYSYKQLHYMRENYPDVVYTSKNSEQDGRAKNVVYDLDKVIETGITPSAKRQNKG